MEEVKQEVKQMSLTGILDGEKPAEIPKEVVKEVPKEAPKEVPKQAEIPKETPKEVPKEEVKYEPTEREKAFQAAALDERRKRQDLEKRLNALEEKKKAEEPQKEFWEAPEETLNKFRQEIEQEKQLIRSEGVNMRLATTETLARARYKDFDEKVQEFVKFMEETPEAQRPYVHNQWLTSNDPAEFAYKTGESRMLLRQAGSLDKLMAQKEKEIRIKIESELKEKEEALKKERESIPGTLSDTRGMTQQKTEWSGPASLEDVLRG